MKINGIVVKLGTIIMFLFLIILLPLGFFIDRIFLQVYSTQVHENVNEHSKKLAATLEKNFDHAPELYDLIGTATEREILVINPEGMIVSHSVLGYKKGKKVSIEFVHILKEGKSFERGYTNPETKEQYFFVGRPIIDNGTFKGGVFVFSSIDQIHQLMHNIRNWIIKSIMGSIMLAFGFTLFVSKRVSDPLLKMEKATREIARGNLKTRIEIKSHDELGSLAQAINDLNVELNNYRENRSELLANISHELRTPISYLKGYAQLIREHQYRNKDELESFSMIIEQESERLSKLIQDLFELSKMEEGRINLFFQMVDIENLIEEAIRKVRVKAFEKNLDLQLDIKDELPSIYSDGSRIEQVLLNLLENAINYTEAGSVMVKAKKQNDSILIKVKDTGIGIPEEDLPFIFERFHRVEKSRSREMGGTGLGLAIVAGLVNLLQGNIQVNSKHGEGTEFCIRFPLRIENHVRERNV
jgi:signal transduction histidine kinase